MEKTLPLDPSEMHTAADIDRELTQAWAQIGMLSEQLDQARRQRDQALERQRNLIRQGLAARGITQFQNARPAPGAIVVTLADDDAMAAANEPSPAAGKPNGAAGPIAAAAAIQAD